MHGELSRGLWVYAALHPVRVHLRMVFLKLERGNEREYGGGSISGGNILLFMHGVCL